MNEPEKPDIDERDERDENATDIPEHMKPENLEKLRDKIHKTLDKKRQIGIAICDERQRGIMHKADGHERGMKASMRAGQLSSALL